MVSTPGLFLLNSAFKWKTPITGVTATAIMMGLSHRRLHARAFFLVFGVSGTKDGALTFLACLGRQLQALLGRDAVADLATISLLPGQGDKLARQ